MNKVEKIKRNEIKNNSTRQHALERPDMYIGTIKSSTEDIFVLSNDRIISKKIEYNPGLERLFIEILANAMDNKWQSFDANIKMTKIDVNINQNDGRITISNDGKWIPIEKLSMTIEDEQDANYSKKATAYRPEFCFTYFRTGVNFNDSEKRRTAGRNGMGSKLSCLYSKEFTFTCLDPENKKKYVQSCYDNLTRKDIPIITKYLGKTGQTEISFIPDYKRFGLDGIDDDLLSLFKKHTYDCSMTSGLNVSFNGEKILIKTLQSYTNLFFDEKPNMISFKIDEADVILVEQSRDIAKEKGYQHMTFVNGIYTKNGGTHLESWENSLLKPIQKEFNGTSKSSKTTKKKKEGPKVKLEQLKKYFFIFVRLDVDNPEFESQSKHEMKFPKEIQTLKLTDIQLKKIMKWDFATYIREELYFEENRKIPKLKLNEVPTGKNIDDANWAKSKDIEKRMQCILIPTEGNSASTIVSIGKDSIPNGHDRIGSLPLRGKVINATNNSDKILYEKEVIQNLVKMLGLIKGMDYSKEENRHTMRYGFLYIFTDSDVDGNHIKGLILNFFWNQFRELFDSGVIQVLNSPAVIVKLDSKKLYFFSHENFLEWQNNATNEQLLKMKPKYYKGLGTHDDESASEIFKMDKRVIYYIGKEDEKYMEIGFKSDTGGKKIFSDKRKDMILKYDSQEMIFNEKDELVKKKIELINGEHSLSDFVQNELILYHIDAVGRMIPDVIDSLKEGQRKILYTCFETNLIEKSIKVVQLAGDVLKHTNYHHGDTSLYGTIIKMAQGFVGSRNIPLLYDEGQYGSRIHGGEDSAQPRYISTKLQKIATKLYVKDDLPLLKYKMDEGMKIEPEHYCPILPILLINGTKGIGSGWSSDIPSYNPEDIIKYIKTWIDEKEKKTVSKKIELKPWWRGFTGTVEIKNIKGVQKVITKGILTKVNKKNSKIPEYHITELPIRMWTNDFKVYLEDEFLKKKLITNINSFNTKYKVKFVIMPHKDFSPDISNMKKLTTSFSLNNMVALVNGIPKKFKDVYEIIDFFCIERYELYKKRKEYISQKLKDEKLKDENKQRFIEEVMENKLIIYKKDKNNLIQEMIEKNYDKDPMAKYLKSENKPFSYLTEMPFSSMTNQKLTKLKININDVLLKIEELEKKSFGELWKNDLYEFEKEYKFFLKERERKEK